MARYNPFRPFQIAPTGMFSGRMEEMEAVEKKPVSDEERQPQAFPVRR